MYTWEKPLKEENYKSRKHTKNKPSFSSTLLDEIYRSIDIGNAEKFEDFKAHREKPTKRQNGDRVKTNGNATDDEEMVNLRRACLVEKWMESEKIMARRIRPEDNDILFFSSTSSSSDSSGALSSSDTEFFGSSTKSRASCFSNQTRLKPVRTGVSASKNHQEEDFYLFDAYQNHPKNKSEEDLIKSKSRALKIYSNLKKVKQPISPGARLTSFFNSLFNNGNGKKGKNLDTNKGFQDSKSSNCSSVSSFSRSCLSKYSPETGEKLRNGVQRTVRFNPLSVIVDQDSRACAHKCINEVNSGKFGRPPLPPNALAELKSSSREKNKKIEEATQNVLKGYHNKWKDEISKSRKTHEEEGGIDYDDNSDSSSDLFELDHLNAFENDRFYEELPVYETTRFDTNHVIASRLVR